MTDKFIQEDFSGNKITTKKKGTNLFRLDNLPNYPAADAYDKLIKNEQPIPINHLFYDLRHLNNVTLLVLSDTHWGSISSHFMATVSAQMIAKYIPNVYLGYNGDNRNNAITTESCVSSPLDNALSPVIELKLQYEQWQDSIIEQKTLFINSGNHENGKRTTDIGADMMATFFAGTPYFNKYSRFATLLTIRLKADNKQGYEDVVIYADHGNSLTGGDGTKLDQGMKLAQQYGARLAIFGHVHQDMTGDYRIKKVVDIETGKMIYDDLSVVLLPATMGSETYALDKRLESAPSELKFINIGTKSNDYLLDSTQYERRKLDKTSIYCDIIPIPDHLWKFGMEQAKKMRDKYSKIKNNTNPKNNEKIDDLLNGYFK